MGKNANYLGKAQLIFFNMHVVVLTYVQLGPKQYKLLLVWNMLILINMKPCVLFEEWLLKNTNLLVSLLNITKGRRKKTY